MEERFCSSSRLKGEDHHGEGGAGGGWSRCIYSQEAEGDDADARIDVIFSIPEFQTVEWYQPHLEWVSPLQWTQPRNSLLDMPQVCFNDDSKFQHVENQD